MDLSQAYGIGGHWKIAVRDIAAAVPEIIAASTQVDTLLEEYPQI